MKHQATNFKRKYDEIEIKDPNYKNPSKKGELIGRRTGKNLGDQIANGNDFLMKNDFSNLLERGQQDMYDLYSSDSNSSSSKENESSSSESEAEESERENSSNTKNETINDNESENKTAKRIKPTLITKATTTTTKIAVNSNVNKTDNKFENDKYKIIKDALKSMEDEPVMEISDVEDKLSEKSDSESDSEQAITPAFANNVIKPNANPVRFPNKFVPQVNAKNNFKSGKKELWSEKDKIKIEDDGNIEIDMSFQSKDNIKQDKNTKSKNVDDSLNLNISNEDSNIFNKNTKNKNNLKNNFSKNTTTVKPKPLLDTNLSTIKKGNNTSYLFTDNELGKDKIDSEEEEEKPNVILKSKIKISDSNKNSSADNKKRDNVILKEKEVNKFEYDDYPNADNDNNQSFSLDINNRNSSKESKKKESKVVGNIVVKEANNKLNLKKEDKLEDAKPKPLTIKKLLPNKENKINVVDEKNSKRKEELSINSNRNTKKRTFSQFDKENLSESQCMRLVYDNLDKLERQDIEIKKNDAKYFGETKKYSLRTRVPKLNHIAGDRLHYVIKWCAQANTYVRELKFIRTNAVELEHFKDECNKKRAPKKKLKKGLKEIIPEEEDKESSEEEASEEDLPEGCSDQEEDGKDIICVHAKSQKKIGKNMNVSIKAKVIEAVGSNHVVIDSKKLTNLKPKDTFEIPPKAIYQISNFSDKDFRIKIKLS